MKYVFFMVMIMVFLGVVGGLGAADRLPNQTPENAMISIDTIIDVVGMVSDHTSLSWSIASPGSLPSGSLGARQSAAAVFYSDSIMTNGGKLSLNKHVAFDSSDQGNGMYNLETEKVMTYASVDGSHLVGDEEYSLSVAGNWASDDSIRCVFSGGGGVPAFCNIVSAKSSLININSAQISTKGQIRAVSSSGNAPAELNYRIAVTPDSNSGSGYAIGTVKTVFAGSIMEARDWDGYSNDPVTWNKTSATNSWKDSTAVTGGIKNFQQSFGYQSGLRI